MKRQVIAITPLDEWIGGKFGCSTPLTAQDLAAGQLRRLNATINRVCQYSPFYRRHLTGCKTILEQLGDLAQLPFTDHRDIEREGLRFSCVSQDEISRVVTLNTSGTSGTPKRLFFTPEDQELTVDFFCWGMKVMTSPGDRVLILFPVERAGGVGALLGEALRRLNTVPILHGPLRSLQQGLEALLAGDIQVVAGPPVPVLALARLWQRVKPQRPSPTRVLLSADYVPESLVRELRKIWHCEVFGHYGMTEMGLGGGVECAAHAGYHLREADLYIEIVDPDSGNLLPNGEWGEVVFTTLTRRGMPLIRYRTGDFSRLLPDECPCGSQLRRLDRVVGRRDGVALPGKGRGLILADLDEALFAVAGVMDYTARLSNEAARTQLALRVLALTDERGGSTLLASLQEALASILPSHERDAAGLYLDLQWEPVGDTLPAAGGKRIIER